MTDFDPYLKWLGIRDPMRPPHHYRLLGIELFENDPDIITGAAKRQIQHVSSCADGPQGELADDLVNRLKAAANVLRSPEEKSQYDQQLRAYLSRLEGAQSAVPTATPVTSVAAPAAPVISTGREDASGPVSINDGSPAGTRSASRSSRPARKKSSGIMFQLVGVVGGGIAAVVVAAILLNSGIIGPGAVDEGPSAGGSTAQNDGAGDSPVVDRNRFAGQTNRPLPEPPEDPQNNLEPENEGGSNEGATGFAGVDPDANPISDSGTNNGVWNGESGSSVFDGGSSEQLNPDEMSQGGTTTVTTEPVALLPVPDDDLLRESRKLIRELYPGAFDRSFPIEEKINLVKEMIRGAQQTDEAENAFTLLSESATIARELNQPKLCLEAIEEMDRQFIVDFHDLTESAFGTMMRRIDTPMQLLELSEVLTLLTIRGIRDGEYDFAVSMSNDAATTGKKINVATGRFTQLLKDNVKDIDRIVSRSSRGESTIQENPADEDAHEAIGDYLCLIQGDFAAGCEHWSQSGDSILIDIALKEQNAAEGPGTDGENFKNAGDVWYEEGAKKQGFRESRMLTRAVHWYEQLLPLQAGLTREVTQKRIDQIHSYLIDLPVSPAFEVETPVMDDMFRVQWAVDVDGGGTFTVRISRDRIFIQRGGRSATFRHTRNNRMFVASLAPNEDAVLIFRIRQGLDRIDYKKVDNATGQTAEWGAGGRNR